MRVLMVILPKDSATSMSMYYVPRTYGHEVEVCIRSTRVHTPAGAAPIRMLPFPAAAHVRTTLI